MKLINADCIEAMKAMPDNSVDSIVTDPPYELGFMGKSWDASGIAFNVEVWREALRVIKPGGHLIAFSGSRTYHRMAVAIEDAGFQIRDQIMWVYGSGFPKSHNISKGIDKAAGAEREVVGERRQRANSANSLVPMNASVDDVEYLTAPATPAAQQWDGWGTALKPAHEPMVLARKPLEGTIANNVLTHGVGGLNIDGSRVVADGENFDNLKSRPIGKLNTRRNDETDEEFDARVGESPEQLAALAKLKELGRFPANFIHDGSDEVVALFPDTKSGAIKPYVRNKENVNVDFLQGTDEVEKSFDYGDSGSAARFFYCAKASKRDRNEGLDGFEVKEIRGGGGRVADGYDESTKDLKEAARKYGAVKSAKANTHPTVKPTSLMQYLVKLVTPPNGIVLDPFMGSGSTGKACAYEGFDFVGIDQSAEYVAIAQARIDFALAAREQDILFPKNFGRQELNFDVEDESAEASNE
jgi:site-specific DNA-methyltransferase (adenine-specific)